MKKKIIIILPIIIIALIVIVAIPKHNNNDIEETPQEVLETSEVSEPTSEPPKTPEPQPEATEPETVEPEPEVTEPEATETVEGLEDGINSTHTDVELGEDEYKGDTGVDALNAQYNDLSPEKKAEVDAALERAKKKHPEWFTDDTAGNTNTGEGNYEHVGTPSTGELPTFEFGQGDYSAGAGAQVY